VFVAFGIQPAVPPRRIVYPALQSFFLTLSYKTAVSSGGGGGVIEHKMRARVFYYQQMHKRIVLKGILKVYIGIKTAPICFGAITIIRERSV